MGVEISYEILRNEKNQWFKIIAMLRMKNIPTKIIALDMALFRLHAQVDDLLRYVDDISAGNRKGEPTIGHAIGHAVYSSLENLNDHRNNIRKKNQFNLLLVVHVYELLKMQTNIAEPL